MPYVEAVELLGTRYRLVERLGSGGMSEVWRAHDEVLDRQVAVKVLSADHVTDASREWIRAEAQAAARLNHPHITNVYDFGESKVDSGECVPYVVMELVVGQTLAERIKSGSPLPRRTVLLVCAQVAAGLAAAHARGLVHRDIKPANVMLSAAGAKVVDFGIAAVAGAHDGSPGDKIWGTPAYLAPERLAGGAVVPESDVYALGVLLYRLLTGSLPWHAETTAEMLEAHLSVAPASLPDDLDLPENVATLVDRCMAKEPEDRPPADEVARVLAAASGLPVTSDEETGDIVIAAGAVAAAGIGASWSDLADVETRVVPLKAAAGANAPGTPGQSPVKRNILYESEAARRRRRHRRGALVATAFAVVLLAVGGLTGFCAAGYGPGDTPGAAAPSASGPSVGGPAQPGTGPSAGSTATPGIGERAPGGSVAPGTAGEPFGGGPPVGTGTGTGVGGGANSGPVGDVPPGGGGNPGGGNPPQPPPAPPAPPPPPPAPPPPPPPQAPAAVDLTVPTPGGSVTCRCVGSTATLIGWDPLPGFTAVNIDRGPGTTVGLTLRALVTDVRVTFRCRNGRPVPSIS